MIALVLWGTDGSNPSPSTGESRANSISEFIPTGARGRVLVVVDCLVVEPHGDIDFEVPGELIQTAARSGTGRENGHRRYGRRDGLHA
jgi:hypothetical protein